MKPDNDILNATRFSSRCRSLPRVSGAVRCGLIAGLAAVWLGAFASGALAATAAPVPPAQPSIAGSVFNAGSLSGAVAVAVSGQYAYSTAYWPGQLTVVSIANPAHPAVVGTTSPTTSLQNGSNVTVAGHYAFVVSKNRNASTASNDGGTGNALTIVDISNPAAPSVVGSVHSGTQLFGAYGIAVSGNFAYVAYQGVLNGQPASPDTSTGGFTVIDITNKGGPAIVGNLDNSSLPAQWKNALQHSTSVALSGHYAYVTAFYNESVTVIDISNPASPQIVASLRSASLPFPVDLTVSGSQLYVADQSSSIVFTALDISNPLAPKIEGVLNAPSLAQAYRIATRGSFAYLVAKSGAAGALDLSNPLVPRLAGVVQDSATLGQSTGIGLDATGRYLAISSAQPTSQTFAPYPPFPPVTGGIVDIALDPKPIAASLTSTPAVLTTSTTASFTASSSDAVSTLRCQVDAGAATACLPGVSVSYSGLAVGRHTFTVRATDAAGASASQSFAWTVGVAPKRTGAPRLRGAAAVGLAMKGSAGSWAGTPTPTLKDQWLRCNRHGQNCGSIAHATHLTYTPTTRDAGARLRLRVTASNALGKVTATSAASSVVVQSVKARLTQLTPSQFGLTVTIRDPVPKGKVRKITITLPHGVKEQGHGRTVKVTLHPARRSATVKAVLTGQVKLSRGVKLTIAYTDSSGAHVRVTLVVR